MKTNILVQYQGGGYDGCIWEWNYFYIDKAVKFHNIQSSGCDGIETLRAAQELIRQDNNHTYIYDLNNEQDIETFSMENHAWNVQHVCRWFENHNSPDAEFFAVCSVCKGHTYADDTIVEGKEIMCYECYSIGECSCCESYVGDTEIVKVNPDEHNGHDYICTDCKEYHDADRKAEVFEDLRWQAFCTGMPDMFSGELRDARIENRTGGGL